ncbi:MAG: D-2-hydroxyacid dehydrogenase [Xanthobacteraceae bacterium]
MPRLLILLTLPKDVRDVYARRMRERFPDLGIDVADGLATAEPFMPHADALVTFGPHLRDGAILKTASKLKWVQALGTGVDGIADRPHLGKGVIITNIRGIHGEAVSEAAIAGMLALGRRLPESIRNQDQAKWVRWPATLIDGKTVGIYGIGLIAEALAPRCKAMGMTVIGFTTTKRDLPGFDRMHLRSELTQLAPELDFLVLLAPFTDETRHIINAGVFAAMKPGSYLVNLARGGIVDEDAMMAALDTGRLAGAALDVFQTEPLPAGHKLWSMNNVIVTPHLGGFCDTYAESALPTIEHNMECFLRGDFGAMQNVVRR